jgi:hypothetical protein
MYLRKSILAVIVIVSLLAGLAGGFGLSYYKFVRAPKVKASETAQKQQEEMNKMVRHGEIVSIEPDKLTMKVEKGGGDIGQTITASVNEHTSVQIGMGFVSKPNEKVDLMKWFANGDRASVLYKDGQALALHREPRPGEQGQ